MNTNRRGWNFEKLGLAEKMGPGVLPGIGSRPAVNHRAIVIQNITILNKEDLIEWADGIR